MDLVVCRPSVGCYSFLDEGIHWIPNKRVRGEKVLISNEEKDGSAWKNKFFQLFSPTLGKCKTHQVRSFPFRNHLLYGEQPPIWMMVPKEETILLDKMLKLQELGVVKEVSKEPYLIPIFGILKK